MRFTMEEIAGLTDGRGFGPDVVIDGATQDSRAIEPDQLFVPLVAERDGHDFIDKALESGAAAYLTAREPVGGSGVEVADTTAALSKLAAGGRNRLNSHVIGITGSVGKTSTKDLLANALRQTMKVHASTRSFNNEIGVPLTILNASDSVDALVIEMGSRGIGHIKTLCDIASPTIGIVTTVAGAHTSEFGSLDNIAAAKGELVESLPGGGLAVLNNDVSLVAAMSARTSAEIVTFGSNSSADVRFTNVEVDDELRARFTIESPWGNFEACPSTRGAHLVPNAAAAAATALWIGVSVESIVQGLATAELSPWRMEILAHPNGAMIINDAYNANPTSMRGALDSLAAIAADRRIAILGYMGELGESEAADHRAIFDYARDRGIDVLAVGTDLYGVQPVTDPISVLQELGADDAVLIKASRSAGLEVLAKTLTAASSVVGVER